MRIIGLTLLVNLLLAAAAVGQSPTVRYDKFKDITFVHSGGMWLAGTGQFASLYEAVELDLGCTFTGEKPDATVLIFATFTFGGDDWAFQSETSRKMRVIVDGQRPPYELGPATRSADVRTTSRRVRVSERLSFTIRESIFRKIATSNKIELQIGAGFESEFDASITAEMRKVLALCSMPQQ